MEPVAVVIHGVTMVIEPDKITGLVSDDQDIEGIREKFYKVFHRLVNTLCIELAYGCLAAKTNHSPEKAVAEKLKDFRFKYCEAGDEMAQNSISGIIAAIASLSDGAKGESVVGEETSDGI